MGGRGDSARFATLDGLRGIAAMLVMVGHRFDYTATHTYLMVDLFFALSGFVLANAYEERFRRGLSAGRFAALRVVRVYPMFALGMLGGLAITGGSPWALLMVPEFGGDDLYHANVPMWSLLLELMVNVGYAAVARWLTDRRLGVLVVVSGLVLAGAVAWHGEANLGSKWHEVSRGLVRTVFSFAAGVALFRLWRAQGGRVLVTGWCAVPLLGLVGLALVPAMGPVYDIGCILVAFPALIWLGARWEAPWPGLLVKLGELSFPLYCIHNPFVTRFGGTTAQVVVLWVLLVLVAAWLNRAFDRPARRVLSRVVMRQLSAGGEPVGAR